MLHCLLVLSIITNVITSTKILIFKAVNINFRSLKLVTMGEYLLINGSGHDGNPDVYYLEWIYSEIHLVCKEEINSDVDLAF